MSLTTKGRRERVRACFAAGETYRTDPGAYSAWERFTGRSALAYHLGNTRAIAVGNRQVRRGTWDDGKFLICGVDIMFNAERAGGRVTIENTAVLAALEDAPMVIVANHMSSLETFLLPALCTYRRSVCIVLKRSLLDYPLMGRILRHIESIGVERVNPREDLKVMMNEGLDRLSRGSSVVVFPQSTRMTGLSRSQFNSVGAKLAKRAGVKLLPVAVQTDFHGVGKRYRDFGPIDPSKPIRLRFGKVLDVEGNGREAHEACLDFIEGSLREWGMPVEV